MMTEDEERPNPFEVFDEIAPMLAFCHMKYGEDGLRYLLQWMVDPSSAPARIKREAGDDWPKGCIISREQLERYAEELEAVGLKPVADIVTAYAASVPDPVNPFPMYTPDWRNWQREHKGDFSDFMFNDSERRQAIKR